MNMKKIAAALLAACLVLSCSACGDVETNDSNPEKQAAVENMKSPLTIGKLTIDIPLNFYVKIDSDGTGTDKMPVVYMDQYPNRQDNITFTMTGKKQNPEYYTATAIDNIMSTMLDDYSGVTSYVQGECWGYTTVKAKYKFHFEEKDRLQTQYYIFTDDDMYLLTFTAEDEAVDSQFEQAITTIVIQ